MRILHVSAPAPYGGLEEVVKSLAGEQVRAGHTVAVAAVLDDADSADPPLMRALRDRGVETHELRLPPRAYWRERKLVRSVCEAFGPDVVHTHGYRADVLHGGVARKRGIAAVTTVHGFIGGGWKSRVYEWLQRREHRRRDAVVAVSRPLEAELVGTGVPRERVHCIPNAWVDDLRFMDEVEARRRLGLEAGRPWIGFVGRLGQEKGADVFVDAFDHIDAGVAGVMIGDGHLRKGLEARVEERFQAGRPEDTPRVRFAGMVPQAGQYMKALDVFVLSSRTEGTPIALLEAIAAGVPVVATRVGGVPDVVSEAEAVLVEPERPRELAAAIERVLADPGAARVRADRAWQRLLDELGPEQWVARYDAVYRAAGASGEAA